MDCFVCHKESSKLRTLSETGFQTLKDAARAGGKILPPDVFVGVYHSNVPVESCTTSVANHVGRARPISVKR